jgi:hypothetical protein
MTRELRSVEEGSLWPSLRRKLVREPETPEDVGSHPVHVASLPRVDVLLDDRTHAVVAQRAQRRLLALFAVASGMVTTCHQPIA